MPTAGEQLGDALEKVARLIPTQLKAADDLMAIVEEHQLYLFDEEPDVRENNPEDDPALGKRIWCVPTTNETDHVWSSDTARFVRRFEVGIGTGSISTAVVNTIEGIITAALMQLHYRRDPQGIDLAIDVAPLDVESILPGRVDQEREPILYPTEVQAIAEVTIVAYGARSLLAPKA